MTAPVAVDYPEGGEPLDRTQQAPAERPEGTAPVRLVLAVEGTDTSDGRFINPGALSTRPMPLTLYAQVRSTHGAEGDAATYVVGAITNAERVPGPQVQQRSTGAPFPDGTNVWLGTGWMYTDVPLPESGSKPAYTLVKDGALYGNSVDLSGVDAEFEYALGPDGNPAAPIGDEPPNRIVMHAGVISSTTIVGIPAFMDAFVELDGDVITASAFALEEREHATEFVPSWRSADVGDTCGPCLAASQWLDTMAVSTAKRQRATKAGHAMPDGSYPIETSADLDNAIRAVGRAGGPSGSSTDRNKVRKHIMKQARRLGLQDKIPDTWNSDGSLKPSGSAASTAEPFADMPPMIGDDIEPAALDFSSSGMIALIPQQQDAQELAVPGADPVGDLHMTLVYLGDQVTGWEPEMIAAVHQAAREATDPAAECERRTRDALARGEDPPNCDDLYRTPGQEGPMTGSVFAHAVFNPNGGPNNMQPATVYLFSGDGDRTGFEWMHSSLANCVQDAIGEVNFPDQYNPFVPHVTAGYNLPVDQLGYTGPVLFDRLRVAIGNQRTDYPLGGGTPLVASAAAAPLPAASIFANPQLTEPTAPTVRDDGTAFGHLALWGTCHIGFAGKCVTPPRSLTDYAYFLVHSARALGDDGQPVTIPVGYGTLSRSATSGGHAGMQLTASEAAQHYDNTCTAVFEMSVGEDDHGIWFAGRLLPGLDDLTEHRARGTVFSGDWRMIRGNLELVAALGVNTPGFPVPRSRVASGQPVALVAAGVVVAPAGGPLGGPYGDAQVLGVDPEEFRSIVAWVNAQRLDSAQAAAVSDLQAVLGDLEGLDGADVERARAELVADLQAILGESGGA